MDYTLRAIGEKLDNGEIQICPHCGRRGLRTEVEFNEWFTHKEGMSIEGGAKMQVEWEMCPKTLPKTKPQG